ncbi:N-ethylammeline chlorohydrolase [Streptococcus pneumoniae]|uniref:N-ethylammeline chlorohydrolase n=2 Tax=Streptococcus pneumoniae TaxID=1313 RepID=A0A4J1Y8U4_STREE|nr:N-ethylammeline chlorohydrolase [Streptococcus pneumoniae]CIT71941.1 N-ethylammeline chlorohydrolase [Streptococcus pneumoniae]CJN65869.1 N-ethylammeline chlorohydrolase [Streptococcus pneumoniae]CJQ96119.1 N-ethylammeline chlorohydrolase [Streptococcus pneumoniae]CVP73734.1 N-ethylammeline chlorohydrolase [Streptococcus pneumoniae]
MRFIVGRFTSFSTEIESFPKIFLYSMKIKVQTRKLAAGCSKHCFEVVDRTDEVSSKHGFEVVDETDEVSNHTYGKATLTWFEEIFEEY